MDLARTIVFLLVNLVLALPIYSILLLKKITSLFKGNPMGEENENKLMDNDGNVLDESNAGDGLSQQDLVINDKSKIWNPESINEADLIKAFQESNKSVIDDNKGFWRCLYIFMIAMTVAFAIAIVKFYTDGDDFKDVANLSVDACQFWLLVVKRLGFIVCVLCIAMPFYKLIGYVIKEIIRSKNEKSLRLLKSLRFTYILKYLGKIDYDKTGFFETNKIKNPPSKENVEEHNIDNENDDLIKVIEKLLPIIELLKKGK